MFSSSRSDVILIKSKSFILFNGSNQKSLQQDFPPDVVSNQEIINEESYIKLLEQFFTKNIIKGHLVTILLSSEILFEKNIPIEANLDPAPFIQTFFDEVPFEQQKVAKLQIKSAKEIYLVAANKSLYELIKSAVEKYGAKVDAVVPITVFGNLAEKDPLTFQDLDKILAKTQEIRNSNFVTSQVVQSPAQVTSQAETASENESTEEELEDDSIKAKIVRNKRPLILLCIFIFLGTIAGIVYFKPGVFFSQKVVQTRSTNVTPSATPESSASANLQEASASAQPAVTYITYQEAKVQVLNGTGTPGQAARASEILEELGFADISTGNAQSSDNQQTLIEFTQTVSPEMLAAVISGLSESFESVASASAQNNDYHIVVTTGNYSTR